MLIPHSDHNAHSKVNEWFPSMIQMIFIISGLCVLLSQMHTHTHASDVTDLPLPDDVRSWSVQQVVEYFTSTTDCKSFAQTCEDQEIDGDSLLDLTAGTLKDFQVKIGPAVKIMRHVRRLKSNQLPEQ